jgi:hypothetical protein
MSADDHPPRDSPEWETPDVCPFCETPLSDSGAGFVDHVAENDVCEERFEAWLGNVRDDMGGDWSG